jgi:hypothetical protein
MPIAPMSVSARRRVAEGRRSFESPLEASGGVFCDGSLNRIEIKQANRNYPSWGTPIEPTEIGLPWSFPNA